MAPIWKDTYYTSSAEYLPYEISYNSNVIFSGRAYAMPRRQIRININKVCADYLSTNIDAILEGGSSATAANAVGTFTLSSNGSTLETYTFLYCWDYSYNWTGGSASLSMPICDTYAEGMVSLSTYATSNSVTTTASTPVKTTGCANYGLYYVNARGGWDAFAIQGAVRKTDNITEFTTDKSFNNTTKEFEAERYLAEIKTAYELHTHYLTDEQSDNLAKNLLSSNKVYLHNLNDGTIKPVLITDKSVKYIQQHTNNGKMAQYTINVVESQSRLRR